MAGLLTGLGPREDETLSLTDPLVSWILAQIEPWEVWRDQEYRKQWSEYYRIWRGKWRASDSQRTVERSRIIAPATQQAIEAQVAEMEESIFARKRWFDIEGFDPTGDPDLDLEAAEIVIDFLAEDMEHGGIRQATTEALLNGALYGCGIIKLTVDKVADRIPNQQGGLDLDERIQISYTAVDPINFLIDPAATTIDDALGVAHVYVIPEHIVKQKQEKGIYTKGPLGSVDSSLYTEERLESRPAIENAVEIIEYHGLVPAKLLTSSKDLFDPLDFAAVKPEPQEGDFREVIAVIANRNKRLRIAENPFVMRDRGFCAFQFDTVPNRFHGRGVAEKAANPQKALDTEMRARIDALSLSTYPMTIVNTLMAPRSLDSRVTPGKRVAVNGNPAEALSVLKLPGPDANSYRHTNDLERMVQMATGSVAPTSPLGVNPTNETASGMSMMLGAMFKRSKRTLRNIEEQLLIPLITKTAWRYMQLEPDRYPHGDYRFLVNSGLGASAREFEVAQLMQFLQTMEPGSPEYWVILRAALENYSLDAKDEILAMVKARLASAMNPQPPQPTIEQQLKARELDLKEAELQMKMQQAQAELQMKAREVEAEARRDEGEAAWNASTAQINQLKAQAEADKAAAEAQEKKAAAVAHLARARRDMTEPTSVSEQ